jgi:hypothetical protein
VSFTSEAIAQPPSCEFQGVSTPVKIQCAISVDGSSITWTIPQALGPYSAFLLSVEKGFNNPISSEPTQTFVMTIYSDSSKARKLDYQDIDLNMIATQATLKDEDSSLIPVE